MQHQQFLCKHICWWRSGLDGKLRALIFCGEKLKIHVLDITFCWPNFRLLDKFLSLDVWNCCSIYVITIFKDIYNQYTHLSVCTLYKIILMHKHSSLFRYTTQTPVFVNRQSHVQGKKGEFLANTNFSQWTAVVRIGRVCPWTAFRAMRRTAYPGGWMSLGWTRLVLNMHNKSLQIASK